MSKYSPLNTSEEEPTNISSTDTSIKKTHVHHNKNSGCKTTYWIIALSFVVSVAILSTFPPWFYLNNQQPTTPIQTDITDITSPPPSQESTTTTGHGRVIATYFPSWSIYGRKFFIQDLDFDKITHILYAFANFKSDGDVFLGDSWSDTDIHFEDDSWNDNEKNLYGNFKQLYLLKKKNRHLKVSLSIGGWTWSTNFPAVASSHKSRERFVDTAIKLMNDLGLDGLDRLFTRKTEEEKYEIVIRGYNKFFNIDETEDTKWENIESNTESPYELTIKENGCIIFIGGLPGGHLLITSKHSLGIKQGGVSLHAIKGKEWVEKHLAKAGKSQTDLATFLYENKLTAVAELCDDSFEEHILPYPPEMINEFAKEWGFIPTHYIMKKNVEEIKEFTNEIGKDGHYDGRAIEGFVVRTKYKSTGECFFFKVKYEEPYLMYRELREVTKAIINGKPPRFKYKLTQEYNVWVKEKLKTEPDIFKGYLKNQGIFRIREMFLNDLKLTGDALNSDKLAKLDNDQINKELKKTLIITVASIGCGKTSLSTALTKLFGFGH
ncbi:10952_t:CDS:2, partial [Entrophospora sp. SA101]